MRFNEKIEFIVNACNRFVKHDFFLAEQRKKERKKKNFGSEEMVRTEKMHATKNNNNK